jgi:protein TonB
MRSCPECADLYPDDMRFCPIHGIELDGSGAVPAWERTTEHNPLLKAPDTTRNLVAPTFEAQVDTHPSGMLLEVPRVTASTPLEELPHDTARLVPRATLPGPRPRAGRQLGLALAAGLALVLISAAGVVGGWYAWRSMGNERVAAAPAIETPFPETAPPEAPEPPLAAEAPEEPALGPVAPAPPEPSPEPPVPAKAAKADPGGQNQNRARPAPEPSAGNIEPDRVPPPKPASSEPPVSQPPPARPSTAPAGPVRMGSAELDGRARKRAEPKYPSKLREKGVRGTVVVEVVIDTDGKVDSARAVSGPGELQKHAVKAARKWKFSPSPQQISGTLRFTFQ